MIPGKVALYSCAAWLLACAQPAEAAAGQFWDTWGDGQAEVSTYDLVQPRYGEPRAGHTVLIYVTEPFVRSSRVKADPGNHPDSKIFHVLKLNRLSTFQTGVYPYRLMTSTFTHVDPEGARPRGSPTKVTFSAQEWCGNTFHELLFDQNSIRDRSFSYFDGEADQIGAIDYPPDALVGDNLLVTVRGMFGDLVARGESRTFAFLPSLEEARLGHKPLAFASATLSRAAEAKDKQTPAGLFGVDTYVLESPGRPTLTVFVEATGARRVVGWQTDAGASAVLRASRRMKYWQHNAIADEPLLQTLGLPSQRRR